jgi:hypothetical protein
LITACMTFLQPSCPLENVQTNQEIVVHALQRSTPHADLPAVNSLAPWWGCPTPRLPSLPQSITQFCDILNCSNKRLPPAHSNTANRSHPQQSARVHAAVHLGPLFLLGPQRSTATSYNCLPLKIMGKKWIWPSGFVWVSCTSQSTHQHSSSHSSST